MLKKAEHSKRFSKPIVWLSIAGITLGLAVMILTISIATGFQTEIKQKLLSFGNHVQIEPLFQNSNNESSPMSTIGFPLDSIIKISKASSIQKFAYKPAIVQTKNNSLKDKNGKTIREVEGVIFKGLGSNYHKEFFKKYLIKGEIPVFAGSNNDTVVLSNYISKKLRTNLHDKISGFFIIDGNPKQRNLTVGGVYETGLQNIDEKFCFIGLDRLSNINKWGLTLKVKINQDSTLEQTTITCTNSSKKGELVFNWNNTGFDTKSITKFQTKRDTVITLVGVEIRNLKSEYPDLLSIPDTLIIEFKNKQYSLKSTEGSNVYYTGGYELSLNNYDDILSSKKAVSPFFGPEFATTTIQERYADIFKWLELIYQNVYIIIILMIIVAIINMTAALLVLIVERTKMIGILKAMGMKNWGIRKIFVLHGGYLIGTGFFFGNLLAGLIILIQNHYQILTLPQENYYLSVVPMHFPIEEILFLNLTAFIVCFAALLLPSYLTTKVTPVKAIQSEI
jgi:lipoprotein-releasing system permease protein